jgi:nondiscriminating aspartyl-tRNA synthetase
VNHVHRILSTQLAGHPGEKVRLAGWVHRRRLLKSVAFLILRDRAGLAQVVVRQGDLATLPEETVVEVTGTVAVNPAAPGGAELVEPTITGLSGPAEPPPFDLYRPELSASLPVQLDHAPLALRHLTRRSTLRLSAAVVAGFRRALDELGFTEIHTPKIVGSATESGANVFAIDYFGRPAYLAQSPQFYKQMMVGVVERVYEVGPVFRAEPHDTGRHLAQYTSLDAELGFITDHRDVMAVVRHAVAGMAPSTVDVPEEIPAVHFADALSLLGVSPEEPDLAPEHERRLGEWASREYGSDFLFVTGYPMAKRPFYTYPQPDRPAYSNSFDLLFRGMEISTGGQRLHRYPDYVAALAARGERVDEAYLETFRFGMPPHGGFAIGLERFVARVLGVGNVRRTTPFPRDLHRLSP